MPMVDIGLQCQCLINGYAFQEPIYWLYLPLFLGLSFKAFVISLENLPLYGTVPPF